MTDSDGGRTEKYHHMSNNDDGGGGEHLFPLLSLHRRAARARQEIWLEGVSRGLPIPNFFRFFFLSGAWAMGTMVFLSSDASSLDVLQQSNPNETAFTSLEVAS